MMKRLLFIVTILTAVIPMWGQNTKKMNSIKRNPLYLYAEATMETAADAFDVANDLLLIQIKEYAESKKSFRDKDILIRDIQGQRDSLQIRRGDMVKVFLYVKKSNILNVDNVTLVDNTSSSTVKKDNGNEVSVENNIQPVTPARQNAAAGDPSLKLEVAWQQEVVDKLLSAASYSEARSILTRLKAEFKIKKTGPMDSCRNPADVFLLIGKDSAVVTVLGPGNADRTDFRSLGKTSDNYNGYDKVWFTFSK